MSDLIIGTAVLDTSRDIQWLHYIRKRDQDGYSVADDLPVKPHGAPQPATKLPSWFPENRSWQYTIAGDVLHVTPSVKIGDYFHNAGQWDVKFVPAEVPGDREACRRQLARLNPTARVNGLPFPP